MAEDHASVWNAVQAQIQRNLPNDREFDTWFKPVQLTAITNEGVTLEVDNPFFESYLKDNHHDSLIQDAFESVTGVRFAIHFTHKACAPPSQLGTTRHPTRHPTQHPISHGANDDASGRQSETRPAPGTHGLVAAFTFDTFVTGPSNQFAHAACRAVGEMPAKRYNPLFIYGGVGLGKTHLLHAVGHEVCAHDPDARITYVTSEQYINELIDSIRLNCQQAFRERYRSQCDVLLIDDIQFIAGKDRTQEEFFHTFNALHFAGKQIVLTSDQLPQDVEGLEERLRSRFQSGLIADIQPPEIETRIAILKQRAERDSITLPDDVAMFIAENVRGNVRILEGALNRLQASSMLNAAPITLTMARSELRDVVPISGPVTTVDDIIQAVAAEFEVKASDLKGPKRDRAVTLPRQVAMYLTRRLTKLSFPEIGSRFGGRDHSTVMASFTKIEKLMETDEGLRRRVMLVEQKWPR